jgi:hypothetical protein
MAVWPYGRMAVLLTVWLYVAGCFCSRFPPIIVALYKSGVQRYNDGRETGTEASRYMAILYMYERYEIYTFFSKYVTMEKKDIFYHNF